MPPTAQGRNAAVARRDQVQIGGRCDQARGHAKGFRFRLEQDAQQVGQRRVDLHLVARDIDLRHILGPHLQPFLDRGQDTVGDFGLATFAQQKARPAQFFDRGRPGRGQFQQRVVLHHPAARHVLRLRIGFAEPGQRLDHGQEPTGRGAGLDPLPGLVGVDGVGRGIGQDPQFLGHPVGTAVLGQLRRQPFIDHPQMGHIGQGIVLLRLGQRAARPVGKAAGLVQIRLGDLLDQGFIADLFAKAADHCGDLGVEQGFREHAAFDKEDLQILAGGVEHLDRRLVAKEVIKRLHRHVRARDRVDQHRLAISAGQSHLDQAQLGPVGPFAQEFGIERYKGLGLGRLADLGEVFGRGDRAHGRPFVAGSSRRRQTAIGSGRTKGKGWAFRAGQVIRDAGTGVDVECGWSG